MNDITITSEMRNRIVNAVYDGLPGEIIGEIAADYLIFDTGSRDYTVTTLHLLKYYVADAIKHPKHYTSLSATKNIIQGNTLAYARRVEKDPLGKAITGEFWMTEEFVDYGYIAAICKLVADTILARGKRR